MRICLQLQYWSKAAFILWQSTREVAIPSNLYPKAHEDMASTVDLHFAGPIFVKGVIDANPNAMDKCLEALLAFLQNTSESQAARRATQSLQLN